MADLWHFQEICGVLAFYADRLDLMRRDDRIDGGRAYGADYLSDRPAAAPYKEISPWYRVVEPIYAELDGLMQVADRALAGRVLDDARIKGILPNLHRIRACYEFDKEMDQARRVMNDGAVGATLARLVEQQMFWTLTPAMERALSGAKSVAVFGSGPLPLTAFAIASALGCQVTCIERDREAFELAAPLSERSPWSDRMETIAADIDSVGDLDRYDAVVGTVLLGVSMRDDRHQAKSTLIGRVLKRMRTGAPLIIREPYRLGRLFYPALEVAPADELEVSRFDPDSGPGLSYRSSLLVLRRADEGVVEAASVPIGRRLP